MKKHEFKPGDYTRVESPEQRDEIIDLLESNGYPIWESQGCIKFETDNIVFYHPDQTVWYSTNLKDVDLICSNEIPISDFIALVKMELPEKWCIRCTEETQRHPLWTKFLESIGGFVGDCLGEYYGDNFKSPNQLYPLISFNTWSYIYELNDTNKASNHKRIPLTQGSARVNENIDQETIDALNRLSELVHREPEFDPSKPFEVMQFDKWYTRPNAFYVGIDRDGNHVIQQEDMGYYCYSEIRNTKPKFTASMLEVDECMESIPEPDGKRKLIKRITEGTYLDIRYGGMPFCFDLAEKIEGEKVNVEFVVTKIE